MEVEQKQKLRTRALFMASHLDGNKKKDQGGRTLQHFPPIVASGQNILLRFPLFKATL